MSSSRLRLIILGAPGSGKGTISSRIVKEFKLNHLSAGDLLRANIENKTEIGTKAKDLVAKGKLLPDDYIAKIVLQQLRKLANTSWLLDGFPRTIGQAKILEKENIQIDKVIDLNVPFDVIINRLKHRWVHPSSGRVYNLEFNPPKVPRKDDVTGDPLIQRPDDQEDIVLERLKHHKKQIEPLVDFYKSKNLVETFTGNTSDYLWPLINKSLHALAESNSKVALETAGYHSPTNTKEARTHTGQLYAPDDYRRARFENVTEKLVNKNFAIDLIKEEPIVVCDQRVVWSSGGGALGHPKVYINLDPPEVQDCGYSGRRFIKKKYYDAAKHGPSITYQEYMNILRAKEELEYS